MVYPHQWERFYWWCRLYCQELVRWMFFQWLIITLFFEYIVCVWEVNSACEICWYLLAYSDGYLNKLTNISTISLMPFAVIYKLVLCERLLCDSCQWIIRHFFVLSDYSVMNDETRCRPVDCATAECGKGRIWKLRWGGWGETLVVDLIS